ncbi:MAG: radical SAM protein [Polyangiaceae bacterium]|nr:radical SAM protein [Polyangiaceae bacterium]
MSQGRRVALICIDPWTAGHDLRPFNYGVRKIQATLLATPGLDADVHLVESRSRDVDELVDRVEALNPDIVGAAAYVWSFPTFIEAARRLKKTRPDRTIVFGGPSARTEMMDLPVYTSAKGSVDALVLGEGEHVFRDIVALPQRDANTLLSVSGTAVYTSSGFQKVGDSPRVPDLDDLASAYQMGLVPDGVQAHLETFRGCPLACSFCQWGDAEQSTRVFSKDYLVRELTAYRRANLGGAILVDAALNLNPRAFRNLVAAEREVGFLRETALDFELYPSHMTDEHARFLSEVRIGRVGVGLQSYDKEVLRKLQRPFDESRFERVVTDLSRIAPVTIEIIMGLPGDSRASFQRTFDRARKLPAEVRVFHCLALPDALMTRLPEGLFIDFDPVSLMVKSCSGWSADDLREESERLTRLMEEVGGWPYESAWTFPGPATVRREPARERESTFGFEPANKPLAAAIRTALEIGLREATAGAWSLVEATQSAEGVTVEVVTAEGNLTLDLRPATAGIRAYRLVDGVAYSYRPGVTPPSTRTLRTLDAVSTRLRRLIRGIVVGPGDGRVSLPRVGMS